MSTSAMSASRPRLEIVVAVAENGVIGRDGAMPWRLPTDLKHFKALTLGRPVVMGRKTFQSLGKPLADRPNLVVSRDPAFTPEGVTVFPELDLALAEAERLAEVAGCDGYVVAGGGVLYAATIDRADRIHLTRVHVRPQGDTVFPAIDPERWHLVESRSMDRGPRDSADATFEVWDRRNEGSERQIDHG